MAFSMAGSLSNGVADYTATVLSITPQNILPTIPSKNQQLLWTDDEAPLVININDDTTFTITLNFNYIDPDDAETIMDFWTDTAKANGMANTFYWVHPTDSRTYVARFISKVSHEKYNTPSHDGVKSVKIYISAVKEIIPSSSASPSISASPSPSVSPSASESPSISPSESPSISASTSPSVSLSLSASESPSISASVSLSPSASISPSASQSPSASVSPSISPSISASVSPSISASISPSPSASQSPSASISPSISPSISASVSPSISASISPSPSASQSPSASISPSISASVSPSASADGLLFENDDKWVKEDGDDILKE